MVHVSRDGGRRGDLRKLGQWSRAVLQAAGVADSELSVVLCDDACIRRLNAQWRDKDRATDVLSFPQDGREGPLLGDVVISVQTAVRQAVDAGHGLDQELQVLLVHGICHLLGHDHHSPTEAAEMGAVEAQLLAALANSTPGLVQRAGPR